MNAFSAALSALYMSIGYTGLLPVRMKPRYCLLLFGYIFSLDYWFGISYGQWITPFLILGNSFIIYLGCQKDILSLSLALAGHLLLILIDYAFSIPLSMIGIPISALRSNYTIYFTLASGTTYIFLRLIRRRFLLPRLSILSICPKRLLRFLLAELYIGLGLMAANFIYGESVSYPVEVLSYNGMLITIFTLSALLIFYHMYDILKKNHELSLQQTQAAIMQDYAHRMESLYEEMRVFRHDYQNILATMQHYIDAGRNEALREYFYQKILNSAPVLSDDGFLLGRLHLIEDNAVKSLLYTKIVALLNQEMDFGLEIAEPVPVLPMDSLALCRILGILLDNAAEAALESPERKVQISIVSTEAAALFVIANSTLPLSVPVSQLLKRGYSAKEGHEGIGLATVAELLDACPYANLSTKYEGTLFCQTLEIQKTKPAKGRNQP